MSSSAKISVLLQETGWIRALARSLAGDVHLADDLVQDAWVTALGRPPAVDRPVRGWLATVLRHRLGEVRRERVRREGREQAAAREEALPSAHDVVERASVQRRLVEAVLELEEPYRTTLLLRFFEELPQREIARRMQTSTATVNSRLTRALEKLRVRLSREGGRTTWLQVLVPLLREPSLAQRLDRRAQHLDVFRLLQHLLEARDEGRIAAHAPSQGWESAP
jgi:RNA polymerase sigma factor (sigma-70 family)